MVERNDNDQLLSLIDKYSFEKFYCHYKAFQFNHMAHGQISLFRLGAPLEHIENFSDHLTTDKLESKGGPLNQEHDKRVETVESIEALKGKRSHYYEIYDYMKNLLETTYKGNVDDFIAGEFPKYRDGTGNIAMHAIIHLGYGYAVGSATVVLEAMAFLHFSYFRFNVASNNVEKFGHGGKTLTEIASLMQNDAELYKLMIDESGKDWVKKTSYNLFSAKLMALMGAFGERIHEYTQMLECPTDPETLKDWLIDQTIILYQASENKNDFFLLHGITGSWGLSKIIPLIKSKDEALETLQTIVNVLLSIYVVQEYPKLLTEQLENPDVTDLTWDALRQRVIEMPVQTDEHVFKAVQVCYETSLRNPAMSDICKRASLTVIENKLYIGKFPPPPPSAK